jgi:hypothetical protein
LIIASDEGMKSVEVGEKREIAGELGGSKRSERGRRGTKGFEEGVELTKRDLEFAGVSTASGMCGFQFDEDVIKSGKTIEMGKRRRRQEEGDR